MEQNAKNLISKIPKEVSCVTDTLEEAGFEAYLVGGCVRDLLMDRKPKDWDITTNAKPEEITLLFEKTVYENKFGTVAIIVSRETRRGAVSHETKENNVSDETDFVVEVTPYRIETKYGDFRHPDEVKFSNNLEDDLKRRDFTINALAFNYKGLNVVDMFGGLKDIKDMVLKTVGNPDDRFQEDALRMIRAVRFACQLDFSVLYETSQSILKNADLIKKISSERIHDEFSKIILSQNPSAGILMLQRFGLLKHIIPELEEGIGCEQSGEHIYDVWDHLLHALQHAADKNWPLEVRLAALFHDIGKPRSRRQNLPPQRHTLRHSRSVLGGQDSSGRSENSSEHASASTKRKYTFYGHEMVGAQMAKKIMERLKFTRKEIELVEKLVRNHMFFSDTELITLSAVRRIITKVGRENIWTLMNVRECDRVGMRKKEAPYRLRKYFAMIEEAMRDPISVSQLKINGEFMKKELNIAPGPRMGWILHALLEEVLDDPTKNTEGHLSELVGSLNILPDGALKALGDRGKSQKETLEAEEISKLRKKHGVEK